MVMYSCGGAFVLVWCSTGVVLEWCFCWLCFSGGVFVSDVLVSGVFVVVWCSSGVVLEWCFCGGVFLVLW